MHLSLTSKIWKEGKQYIAYVPELDLSSQGTSRRHAEKRLNEATTLFFEEMKRMGTLPEFLTSMGFHKKARGWSAPKVSSTNIEIQV